MNFVVFVVLNRTDFYAIEQVIATFLNYAIQKNIFSKTLEFMSQF